MEEAVCDSCADASESSTAFCTVPLHEAVLQSAVLEERYVGQQLEERALPMPFCQRLELYNSHQFLNVEDCAGLLPFWL